MTSRLSIVLATLLAFAPPARASCGSAFCTLMTDRYATGTGLAHAGWSSDLRIESVSQTQLRHGNSAIAPDQVVGEEAIERHTVNRNLVESLEYGFGDGWSLTLRLPLLRRDHLHDLVDEQTGLPATPEQWRFTKLGDVQLLARRQFSGDDVADSWALFGGLKLATGSTKIANAEGVRAERALQPGSGTTDGVVGVAGRHALGPNDALVLQAGLSQALNSNEEFKPGRRLEFSAGWSHAWTPGIGSVLQLNLRQRGRDAGAQAEPDNSGSTRLDLSPGLTFGVGSASTLYAYLQLPLVQKVNGIQLVPRSALAVGWTCDF